MPNQQNSGGYGQQKDSNIQNKDALKSGQQQNRAMDNKNANESQNKDASKGDSVSE